MSMSKMGEIEETRMGEIEENEMIEKNIKIKKYDENARRPPEQPEFWTEHIECEMRCYICGTIKEVTYVRQLGINLCGDDCFESYLKLPKPSMLYIQSRFGKKEEEKIPQMILTDFAAAFAILEDNSKKGKVPVFLYDCDCLLVCKQIKNTIYGTFPQNLLHRDDLPAYKFAWGHSLAVNSYEAEWFPIEMNHDYSMELKDGVVVLYSIFEPTQELYRFDAVLFNKYKT